MQLTDVKVRNLRVRETRFEVTDGNGLAIRITPHGTRTWIYRYKFKGVPRRLTLGQYPAVGLAEARVKHGLAMQAVQRGVDPGAARQAAKVKIQAETEHTIGAMFKEFWRIELKHKRSGPETLRLLEKDVLPVWGKRDVAEIKRRDIVLLLDKIGKRAPFTRNRVHSALGRFFNFAAERGVIEDSPCTRIRKPSEASRTRVLSDDEIKALWWSLALGNENIDVFWTTKLALRFQMLTGQRSGEICHMTTEELDLERNTWTLPAKRMKNNAVHTLPLTPAMRSIIEESKNLFGAPHGFVFPSLRGNGPITRASLSRAVVRHHKEMGVEDPFTPHDVRRTVRTRLAEIGVDDVVAERVMGHKLQGMLAVYNQHSYLPEKLAALESWERRLNSIVGIETAGAKVIAIGEGRKRG